MSLVKRARLAFKNRCQTDVWSWPEADARNTKGRDIPNLIAYVVKMPHHHDIDREPGPLAYLADQCGVRHPRHEKAIGARVGISGLPGEGVIDQVGMIHIRRGLQENVRAR